MDGFPQFAHQRAGGHGIGDAALFCLLMRPNQLAQRIALRRLGTHELIAIHRLGRSAFVLGEKHSFCTGNGGDGAPIPAAYRQVLRDDMGRYHRADGVMDGNQIRFPIVLCQLHDAVANGFLPGFAAGNDVLELCDVILSGVCPNRFMPSIDADQANGINLRMLLKGLQRIDQHGLIVHVDKLLWNFRLHSLARAAGDD